jgi:hypothetical protein
VHEVKPDHEKTLSLVSLCTSYWETTSSGRFIARMATPSWPYSSEAASVDTAWWNSCAMGAIAGYSFCSRRFVLSME